MPRNDNPTVCRGKVGFQSPRLAREASSRGHRVRDVYRCGVCGLFHVGHSSRALRLAGKRPVAAAQRVW